MRAGWLCSLVVVGFVSIAAVGCSSNPTLQPSKATVNGVSSIDRDAGRAELSVSALDAEGDVLASGTIGNVSATVDQSGYTVAGGTCGEPESQITSLGPVTVALTFDATPSLTADCYGWACPPIPHDPFDPNDNTLRREGGLNFVSSLKEDGQATVSYFNGDDGLVEVQTLTRDKVLLEQAVLAATSREAIGSGTPLWDASVSTIDLLADVAGGNRIAIIFTDGGDTTFSSSGRVIAAAQAAGVRVFYIGLGETTNVADMQNIAQATEPNGLYVSAKDRTELIDAFEGVANSSQGSGCIDIIFDPAPSPNTTLTGGLTFQIDGRSFSSSYEVDF